MRLAIMQPYLLPYLGYWQLLNAVDCFVVYDNIQYTKRGWINRNRFLQNGEPETFSIPLKKGADYLDIGQRYLVDDARKHIGKLIRRISEAYRKAPYFEETMPIVHSALGCEQTNLFDFLFATLLAVSEHLAIGTRILVSSSIDMDHSLKGQERVIATVEALGGDEYLNPPGGKELYHGPDFAVRGLSLRFLEPELAPYPQLSASFVSHLSIVDVLMFNGREKTRRMLDDYAIIES